MNWIIDRIEECIAVIEIGDKFIDVPVTALPENIKAGDVLKISVDSNETQQRKQNIDNLMNSLFKD